MNRAICQGRGNAHPVFMRPGGRLGSDDRTCDLDSRRLMAPCKPLTPCRIRGLSMSGVPHLGAWRCVRSHAVDCQGSSRRADCCATVLPCRSWSAHCSSGCWCWRFPSRAGPQRPWCPATSTTAHPATRRSTGTVRMPMGITAMRWQTPLAQPPAMLSPPLPARTAAVPVPPAVRWVRCPARC